jgi:hypothetical protein
MEGDCRSRKPRDRPDRGRRGVTVTTRQGAVTPYLRGITFAQPFSASRIQIPAAFSARFAIARLLKLDFRSSRHFTAFILPRL